MKTERALGIVRKLDELGRIVIPKEVRKVNGWDDGQPMEMFAIEGGLMVKAYDPEKRKQKEDALEILNNLSVVMNEPAITAELKKVKSFIQEAK